MYGQWLDIWSVPQADRDGQLRAISSLQTYVTDSSYFLCLTAPHHKHADTGTNRDFTAWQKRGWCGLEVSANWLSLKAKPLLVATPGGNLESYQFG